jgi:arylformamidase
MTPDFAQLEIFDISRTICEGMAVWPGDPEFECSWPLLKRRGDSCNVSSLRMGTHTGTHVDAPFHVDDSGIDAASLPFRKLIGPARVYSISGVECIQVSHLKQLDWRGVQRVLFKTRSDSNHHDSFEPNYVYLEKEASEFLANCGMLLVGIDAPSVDAIESEDLPSHKILLDHGIIILEEAQLSAVVPGDYELICLPLKLAGCDGAPVRAILIKK